MPQILKIAANAVKAKLFQATRAEKNIVSELLSYEVEGAEFSSSYGSGWDGMSTFFNYRDASFPAGFVEYIKRVMEKRGYVVQIIKRPPPSPLGPENPKVDDFPDDNRYRYQMETVKRLESRHRMVAMLATGGGKSRTAKMAYARIKRRTLFITTRSVLMYQMKDNFTSMGERVGVIGDGEFSPSAGFTVAMVQTIAAMLKLPEKNDTKDKQAAQLQRRETILKILEDTEFVILEEAHEIGGDSYYTILNHCINAHYRLALTATPFMKSNSESNMRLMASAGPVGIKVTEEMLINSGILAKPYFKFVRIDSAHKLHTHTSWPRCYELGIVENQERNKIIVDEAVRAVKYKLPTLILVQRQKHGEIIKDMLRSAGIRCDFIYGKHEQDERANALERLKSGKLQVIIGSTILDVGVDVPALGMIILAGGGKAEVAMRQRIGRGLREKRNSANITFIVDFEDFSNKHLKTHSFARKAIIENTKGFAENIIKAGEDFNFKLLEN